MALTLKYPDGWIAYLLGSNENIRRLGHRAAAAVMLALAAYHTLYLLRTKEGRTLRRVVQQLLELRSLAAIDGELGAQAVQDRVAKQFAGSGVRVQFVRAAERSAGRRRAIVSR